jgi:hypothetical protein
VNSNVDGDVLDNVSCGVEAVSNPKERWGWNRREEPASSKFILVGGVSIPGSDEAADDLDVIVEFDSERCLRLRLFVSLCMMDEVVELVASSWLLLALAALSMSAVR